ncbi:polycystin-2-like [Zootermopsis nevadensis]|uniref:polycystin-2-like n=1 Tax=Zootermopsis nevadensis TaxID=136037 RepID=UPI000B8E3516|nr:polycystin-2-like [Zootermopsis nevadensis]
MEYFQGMKQKFLAYINTNNEGLIFNRKEFIIYIIFLVLVMIGTYVKTDNMNYWFTKHADDLIAKKQFEDGIRETNFKDLSHISHFWKVCI